MTVNRTRADVAKSLPVTTTCAGADDGAAATCAAGGSCVSTPVTPKIPTATATSAPTVRRSDRMRSPRSLTAGTFTYRLRAPSATSPANNPTLINSVTPKLVSHSRRQAPTPPISSIARTTPVTATTASAMPAMKENRPTPARSLEPLDLIPRSNQARPPTHTPTARRCSHCTPTLNQTGDSDPAWPACAWSSMAPAAARPRRINPSRRGRIAATITAIATTDSPIPCRMSCTPADDRRSVPYETPTVERSATVISARPRAAISQAAARTHPNAGSRPPNTNSPSTAPPSRRASPAYNPQRPTAASGDGDGVDGRTVPGDATAPVGATPTPNANELPVTCPSVFETVRHVTVYTPSGRDGRATWSSSGAPGTGSALPCSTSAPLSSSTWMFDSPGSGGSVNVITTLAGAAWSSSPLAGSDRRSRACAAAG